MRSLARTVQMHKTGCCPISL